MSPTFEKIHLPFPDWGKILNTFEDRTIFQSPAWLAFVTKTQRAEPIFACLRDGTRTLGYFSGLIVKRFGLKILGSPLPGWTTSYMGMNLLPGVSRRSALEALQRLAFERLGCVHIEMMDRNLRVQDADGLDFEYREFGGFEIDLTQTLEQLFSNMAPACRRCIRRAEKSGVTIEEAQDAAFAGEYYAQLPEVFQKRSLVPTYGVERVRELITCLSDTGQLLLLRARDPQGRCIATGIFPAMNTTMYFWGGASWRESLGSRPNEAIQWYAMQYWKARGIRRYDMGGGGEYKRKFGGREIMVPWLRKSKYPGLASLRNLTKQVVGWRQRIAGRVETIADRPRSSAEWPGSAETQEDPEVLMTLPDSHRRLCHRALCEGSRDPNILHKERIMTSIVRIVAVAAVFVTVLTLQTSGAQATPILLPAVKAVNPAAVLPFGATTHKATWNWWPNWQQFRQYWSQRTNWSYDTRSVALPGTILLFGAGFAGLIGWRSRHTRRRKSVAYRQQGVTPGRPALTPPPDGSPLS